MMISSKVPAAINEVGIPFDLPKPFSNSLTKHGTSTEGLIHEMVKPKRKAMIQPIPKIK